LGDEEDYDGNEDEDDEDEDDEIFAVEGIDEGLLSGDEDPVDLPTGPGGVSNGETLRTINPRVQTANQEEEEIKGEEDEDDDDEPFTDEYFDEDAEEIPVNATGEEISNENWLFY